MYLRLSCKNPVEKRKLLIKVIIQKERYPRLNCEKIVVQNGLNETFQNLLKIFFRFSLFWVVFGFIGVYY